MEYDRQRFAHIRPTIDRALLRLYMPDAIELRNFRRSLVRLTPREEETLYLLVEGFTNKEVGRHMQISHRTVETYRTRVYEKLGGEGLPHIIKCLTLLRINIETKPRSAAIH